MSTPIKVGDIVSVSFYGPMITLCRQARVDHVPVTTGDAWIFTDVNTESVHYVSEGCTVTKEHANLINDPKHLDECYRQIAENEFRFGTP